MENGQEALGHESGGSMLLRKGVPVLALLLLCTTAVCLFYLGRERDRVRELTASRDEMKAAVVQTRAQLDELSAKLNALSAPPAEAPVRHSASVMPAPRRSAAASRKTARARATVDPRWKQIEDQLSENRKQLASTQEDVKKTREDLEGKLGSTRDELNSSIARNHDELVELQKRGERNYYEFELPKAKQFQRTGPVGLQLRKADTKHKRYDLDMLIDDAKLEKRRVNLFEPILIYLADRPQPVELVVNQITKNQIKGYISEPKYKKSDLGTQASAVSKPQELTPRQ